MADNGLKNSASVLEKEEILESPFRSSGGYSWVVSLPRYESVSDGPGYYSSPVRLYEDGNPLGPAHAAHGLIRDIGNGRYSNWKEKLVFSTSDNSDPNMNGRKYHIVVKQNRAHILLKSRNSSQDSVQPLSLPRLVHLNLTNACNLNCRICRPEGFKYSPSFLNETLVKNVVRDLFDSLTDLRLDSAGELFLSKHLPLVMDEATKRDIAIFISSNGMLLNDKNIRLLNDSAIADLQISFDSPDKPTLEWIRKGANFEQIIKGVEGLVEHARRTNRKYHILFHAAILKQNLRQLPDLVRLAKSIGIDGVSYNHGFIHSYMEPDWSIFWEKEEFNKIASETSMVAKELGMEFNGLKSFDVSKNKVASAKYCDYLFEKSYISPNGDIWPCCTGNYFLGNISEKAFPEIWHGEKYNELRRTYNTSNPVWYRCSACHVATGWDPNDYASHFAPEHWEYVKKRLEETKKVTSTS